jgi:hypothetical protein
MKETIIAVHERQHYYGLLELVQDISVLRKEYARTRWPRWNQRGYLGIAGNKTILVNKRSSHLLTD